MDTYSQALQSFHNGKEPFEYEIVRDDGYTSIVPLTDFFDAHFSKLEQLALERCKGKILDVGAGAGRHTLALQHRKADITAVDISQTAVDVMKERGVNKLIHSDIMAMSKIKFDTLLMLMNGIGMVGNLEKLEKFLIKAKQLLTKNGFILFESVDVSKTDTPKHVSYRERNIQKGKPLGQQKLRIDYAGITGEWFDWLHISYNEISQIAKSNGFKPKLIKMQENGQYIAELQIKTNTKN